MHKFCSQKTAFTFQPPLTQGKILWGLNFRSSLSNSAGMFKNGEAYDLVAKLGAGAYIGGTSTANPRLGNCKQNIKLPFLTLPRSKLAINFLGLPNRGDQELAVAQITQNKLSDCPIGWSVMRSPDYTEAEGLTHLLHSLVLYQEHPQIDFLEINESCPNIKHSGNSFLPRLELLAQKFLTQRQRKLPVIVKFSTDINLQSLPEIVAQLIRLGYDGINLGNTSTNYDLQRKFVHPADLAAYDYFTANFGGGVSGLALKRKSLELCSAAAEQVARLKPDHEFNIIRSGGIDCYQDLSESERSGVALNQWYSGFFENYQRYGNGVYQQLFCAENLLHN